MTEGNIIKLAVLVYIMVFNIWYSAHKENHAIDVIDGDTLKLFGKPYRIYGIDAPELKQVCKNSSGVQYRCGVLSKRILKRIISKADTKVMCSIQKRDKYKRYIAICYADKQDIGAIMVRNGMAVAYNKYSNKYCTHQRYAIRESLGIWKGRFIMPWHYRTAIRGKNIKSLYISSLADYKQGRRRLIQEVRNGCN